LPGLPHEGAALLVFMPPRRLPDEHYLGVFFTLARHHVATKFSYITLEALPYLLVKLSQCRHLQLSLKS
jgi:hypothetical protein